MTTSAKPVAVDMGSSSVRVMVGEFDGTRLALTEAARFPNAARTTAGRLVWPIDELIGRVRTVLTRLEGISSVGVDSWGVDHAIVDADGALVDDVISYRDPRTTAVPDALADKGTTPGWLWERTGIQPAPINTSHQLAATLRTLDTAALERVAQVLLLPDYVAFRLGAEPGWSQAISSTTGLTRPGGREWAPDVLERLGIPASWFGPIAPERTPAGRLATAPEVPIIRAGSHDTACAVHALPASPEPRAFLSSGSWSLLGVEVDQPLLDEDVRRAGFTNEVRTDGGVRLLGNLTGLWILQECARQWAREGRATTWPELTRAAASVPTSTTLIDPDDADFQLPGDMPGRVRDAVVHAGGRPPEQPVEVARVVLDSLAASCARTLHRLSAVTGVEPTCVVTVGGGTRNDLLNQLTADACGLPVIVGAAEATSVGSVLAQLEALGEIGPGDHGAVLAASFAARELEPTAGALRDLARVQLGDRS